MPCCQVTHLEQALVIAPGHGTQVLQQGALVGEGEVEGQVAGILSEAQLSEVVSGTGLREVVIGMRNLLRDLRTQHHT